MIAWSSIKPLVKSQVAAATGLAASNVRWVDEPSGTLAGALPVVWLRVSSIVNVGGDVEVERADNGINDQTVTLVGQKEFTLSIRVESFTPDISDARHAANLGNAIATRLWRTPYVVARAGVFGILQNLSTKWFNYAEAGRPVSTYMLDLLCSTVDVDVDSTTGTGDWVGEVQGTGTIKNTDGSTLATPSIDTNNV